jgi:exosome complex exonuclease RRP6
MAALLGTTSSSAAPEEEGPFDYANAPSVLNAAPDASNGTKKKGKRGKVDKMAGFDPYKKALNTMKGVPRGQRERPGVGGTFKS